MSNARYDAIVIDTTALWPSLLLDGVDFRVLFAGMHFATQRIAIPQVVLDEASRHFAERWQKASNQLSKAQAELTALGATITPPIPAQVAYPFSKPEAWPVPVYALPYPSVPHGELAHRDLDRRKPFAHTGKGYRDALVWYSILELSKTAPRIAFITNNTDDFAEEKGGPLHSHLLCDLPQGVAVELYTSIQRFNADHIEPHLATVEELRSQLEAGTYKSFNMVEWARASIGTLVPDGFLVRVLVEPDGEPWVLEGTDLDVHGVRVSSTRFMGNSDHFIEACVEMSVRARLRNTAAWDVVAGELYFGPEHRLAQGTVFASIRATFDSAAARLTGAVLVGVTGPHGRVSDGGVSGFERVRPAAKRV